ncbi:hypothetical protein [Paenibacillus sp. QZ-Y1]|uniref:hypothetical protein n=1 Tax=Paenibacillus sp. QZ-Y1 TaxID=3414511 RepID=UPI003F797F24
MTVKDEFIRRLIDELNEENSRNTNRKPLDVPFMVSVVDQQLENCKEFMKDITEHRYSINGYDFDEYYANGKIRVLIEKPEEERESEMMYDAYCNYCYYIEFCYDERYWGYCDCQPSYKEYDEKHGCCGSGCDWVAPRFYIEKSISLGGGVWEGLERDYWEYEKKFNEDQDNKNTYVEEMKKKQEIEALEASIRDAQSRLSKLK